MLLRRVLFNLQKVWYFPAIFLLSISSLTPLRSKRILYIISVLFNLLRYVLWRRTQSVFVKFHVHVKRMYTLLSLSNTVCKCQSPPADGTVQFDFIRTNFLPAGSATDGDAEVSNHPNRFVCFSSRFYECWPHVV